MTIEEAIQLLEDKKVGSDRDKRIKVITGGYRPNPRTWSRPALLRLHTKHLSWSLIVFDGAFVSQNDVESMYGVLAHGLLTEDEMPKVLELFK